MSDLFLAVQWRCHPECLLYIYGAEIVLRLSHVSPQVQALHLLFLLEVLMWRSRHRVFGSLCYTCFWNVKLFGRKSHGSSCSCQVLSHTILLNWPWDYCESVKMRTTSSNSRHNFFPLDQSLWSSDAMLTIKLSTSSPVVILLALPIIFFITFCDVLFLFSICKDYPKLHVWTEHGNQMRALAM